MKNLSSLIKLSIIITFCFVFKNSTLFAIYDYNSVVSYLSDRDNFFTNCYGADFTVNNGYLYVLLDTGDVGILKLFKIINGYANRKDSGYVDDNIQWSIYFGNENEQFLRKGHLLFNKGENIRLVLLKKKDDYHCQIKIIDINPDGQIISSKEIGLTFGSDLILAQNSDLKSENYGDILTGIYTEKREDGKKYIKLVQFNLNNEVIQNIDIEDENQSLEANQINISENGEIAVVGVYNEFDCFWGYRIYLFDAQLNLFNIWQYPEPEQFAKILDKSMYIYRNYINGQIEWQVKLVRFSDYVRHIYYNFNRNNNTWEYYKEIRELIPATRFYPHIVSILNPIPYVVFEVNNRASKKINSTSICDRDSSYYQGFLFITYPPHTLQTSYLASLSHKAKTNYDSVYILGINKLYNFWRISVDIHFFQNVPTSVITNVKTMNEKKHFIFTDGLAKIYITKNEYKFVTLILYDLIGNKIGEYKLNVNNNLAFLPLDNIKNGIYFYHILESEDTGKFGVMR